MKTNSILSKGIHSAAKGRGGLGTKMETLAQKGVIKNSSSF